MRSTSTTDDNEITTIYVTSVSDSKQYELDKEQIKSYEEDDCTPDKTMKQNQFLVITVEDNTLTCVAYRALGEEYVAL